MFLKLISFKIMIQRMAVPRFKPWSPRMKNNTLSKSAMKFYLIQLIFESPCQRGQGINKWRILFTNQHDEWRPQWTIWFMVGYIMGLFWNMIYWIILFSFFILLPLDVLDILAAQKRGILLFSLNLPDLKGEDYDKRIFCSIEIVFCNVFF